MARRGYRNGEWLQWDAYYTFDNMATGFKNRGFNRSIGDALNLPDASQVSDKGTFFPYDIRSRYGVKLPIPLTLMKGTTESRDSLLEMEIFTDLNEYEYTNLRCFLDAGFVKDLSDPRVCLFIPAREVDGSDGADARMLLSPSRIPSKVTGDTNGVSRGDFKNKEWVTFRMKTEKPLYSQPILTVEVESSSGIVSSQWESYSNLDDFTIIVIGNIYMEEGEESSDEEDYYENALLRHVKNVRFKYL